MRNSLQERTNAFSLESRLPVLDTLTHSAELPPAPAPFEELFRAAHFDFVTRVAQEQRFSRDFFGGDLSDRVFGRSASLFASALASATQNSVDLLALMTLRIVVHSHRSLLRSSTATTSPVLADYFKPVLAALTVRIRTALREHAASLDEASTERLGDVTVRSPHYVVRRYAELVASLHVLLARFGVALHPLRLPTSLAALTTSLSALLDRLSAPFETMDRAAFLANQHDLIVSLLQSRASLSTPEGAHHTAALRTAAQSFVDSLLQRHFAPLSSLVRSEGEVREDRLVMKADGPHCSEQDVQRVLQAFQSGAWQKSAEAVVADVQARVTNFGLASQLVAQALEAVCVKYALVGEVLARHFKQLRPDALPLTALKTQARRLCNELLPL